MRYFFLASLLCLSSAAFAQSITGDMETWRSSSAGSKTVMQPNGWYSLDSLIFLYGPIVDFGGTFNHQVFQSSDAHGGSSSAQLISKTQGTLGVAPGTISNAKPLFNISKFSASDPLAALSYTGGLLTTTHIAQVTAWIKYLPVGADAGGVEAIHVIPGAGAGGNDSIVGGGNLSITSAISTWTQITVPVSYFTAGNPTQFRIFFYSSDPNTSSPADSSTMWVDDVTYSTTSIPPVCFGTPVVNVSPNPTQGQIYLHEFYGETLTWQAYDLNGRMVISQTFTDKANADMSQYPDGMYFYNITNHNGEVIQRGRFSLVK